MHRLRVIIAIILAGLLIPPPALARGPVTYNVEWAAAWGGATYAAAVQGTTAAVGMGTALALLDVSDAGRPQRFGQVLPLTDFPQRIVFSG
jgi:hypothetical protein